MMTWPSRSSAFRKERDASLKDIVNEALRSGLRQMGAKTTRRKRFKTATFALGCARISIDNTSDALALAEGESHK